MYVLFIALKDEENDCDDDMDCDYVASGLSFSDEDEQEEENKIHSIVERLIENGESPVKILETEKSSEKDECFTSIRNDCRELEHDCDNLTDENNQEIDGIEEQDAEEEEEEEEEVVEEEVEEGNNLKSSASTVLQKKLEGKIFHNLVLQPLFRTSCNKSV